MKEESNNAVDLMLRQLGRSGSRVSQSSGNGEPESNESHLDMDELNAYAENALPINTRARYTEHLADCVRCRQIVSQLSQASGVVIDHAPKVVPPSGLKAFLASLFSPMVLRYAVPALGLLVVASIGFFALRRSRPMEVAQLRQASSVEQVAVTPTPGDTGKSPSITSSSNDTAKSKPRTFNSPQEVDKNERGKAYDDTSRQEKEESREKPATITDQVAVAAPSNSPESAPAAAAAPKPAIEDQKQVAAQVDKNKVQASTPQTATVQSARANDEPATRRAAKEPTREFGMTAGSLKKGKTDSASASGPLRGADEAEGKRERDRSDKDTSETTSVAGHRFRRSGSVWIDVSYSSSQDTTNVKRGSEQYRALIADEPGIRTIADQLQGEVIVVWKGHAYRIR